MTRFKDAGRGEIAVLFEPDEVTALRGLGRDLDAILEGGVPDHGVGDPIRGRLFPRAYVDPTEDRAEREFQSVVHDDLVSSKAAAIRSLLAALDRKPDRKGRVEVTLDPAKIEMWVSAMNDVRLALGVSLGVTEEMPEERANVDGRGPGFATYDWLTYVQGALVDVLLGGMEADAS